MHPIERLRYVARAGWAGPSIVAAEAALALAELAEYEAPALVPACRRLLDRQPGCGPLWWVTARVLCAADPFEEAGRCAQMLEDDPTEEALDEALGPEDRVVREGGIGEIASADVVLIEVDALGGSGMVADPSCVAMLEAARAAEVPVWLQAGVGRVLPPRLWQALTRRLEAPTRASRVTTGPGDLYVRRGGFSRVHGPGILMDHGVVERVVGPLGARSLPAAVAVADCPEPPELLEPF